MMKQQRQNAEKLNAEIFVKTVATNTVKNQKGVVLFFSLIALVIMSLAAVALIRSVDTNNQIAGNLGFKQSTMFSSDTGINTAMAWVKANPTSLNADSPANGYYATFNSGSSVRDFLDNAAPGTDVPASTTDSQSNTIIYVINRMCSVAGVPNSANCLRGPLAHPLNEQGEPEPPLVPDQPTIVYRVTAKVTGPKNTVSYVQTFVY
jgi:type IV pilus assembly protein PilX